uniref:Uncharacterized protein n=1 Tax=Pipistrellus kuhlii TaxID=59472 RepID=A0A7J7Y9A9_PIPKU|nr:hypothetical protein mPipKuh1_010252 [Pipistrellus kuhlii]
MAVGQSVQALNIRKKLGSQEPFLMPRWGSLCLWIGQPEPRWGPQAPPHSCPLSLEAGLERTPSLSSRPPGLLLAEETPGRSRYPLGFGLEMSTESKLVGDDPRDTPPLFPSPPALPPVTLAGCLGTPLTWFRAPPVGCMREVRISS